MALSGLGLPGSSVRWLDKVVSEGLTALMICLREVIVWRSEGKEARRGEIKVRNKYVCIGVQNCRHVCRDRDQNAGLKHPLHWASQEEVRKWVIVCDSTPGWAVGPGGHCSPGGQYFLHGQYPEVGSALGWAVPTGEQYLLVGSTPRQVVPGPQRWFQLPSWTEVWGREGSMGQPFIFCPEEWVRGSGLPPPAPSS